LRTDSHNFVGIIEFQDLFGAEVNADTASLAPFPVDDVFFELGFCHVGSLEISIQTAITWSRGSILFFINMLIGESRQIKALTLNPCDSGSTLLFEY